LIDRPPILLHDFHAKGALAAGSHAFVWSTQGVTHGALQWIDHAPNPGVDSATIGIYVSALPLGGHAQRRDVAGTAGYHTPLTKAENWYLAPYVFSELPGDVGPVTNSLLPIADIGTAALAVALTVVGTLSVSLWWSQTAG